MKDNLGYIRGQVKEVIGSILKIEKEAITSVELNKSFLDLGVNSVLAVGLVEALNRRLGIEMGIEVVFDYISIEQLTLKQGFSYMRLTKKMLQINFES